MTRERVGALVSQLLAFLSLVYATAYAGFLPWVFDAGRIARSPEMPHFVLGMTELAGHLVAAGLLWHFASRFGLGPDGDDGDSCLIRREFVGLLAARSLSVYLLFQALHQLSMLAEPWSALRVDVSPYSAMQVVTAGLVFLITAAAAGLLWSGAPRFGAWRGQGRRVSVMLPEDGDRLSSWRSLCFAVLGAYVLLGAVPAMIDALGEEGLAAFRDSQLPARLRWHLYGVFAEAALGLGLLLYGGGSTPGARAFVARRRSVQ
jgi:hypothetical protein